MAVLLRGIGTSTQVCSTVSTTVVSDPLFLLYNSRNVRAPNAAGRSGALHMYWPHFK
jgi:hypothetical protein